MQTHTEDYFQHYLGVSFQDLIAPIDAEQPAGVSVSGNGVYTTIKQAREQDDPSLPMGQWEYELKRADWGRVSTVAANALAHKSKDLQLAAWLLEAQINQHGFAGVAACINLIKTLCDEYWLDLHPQLESGDLEHRANILRWVNEKLLPPLRLVPITACGRNREYSLADWEQAHRNEQVRASLSPKEREGFSGLGLNEFLSAMASTPTDAYLGLHSTLGTSLTAIAALIETLDQQFGNEAPSLGQMNALLTQIRDLLSSELQKRGVRQSAPESVTEPDSEAETELIAVSTSTNDVMRERAGAYAQLAQAAEFLMRLEPHSPVPYLVRRAIEWGQLNTAELYQELFLRCNGQISIFELMGLDAQVPADD